MLPFLSPGKRESLLNRQVKRTCVTSLVQKKIPVASNVTLKCSKQPNSSSFLRRTGLRVKSPWKLLRPDLLFTTPLRTDPSLYCALFILNSF